MREESGKKLEKDEMREGRGGGGGGEGERAGGTRRKMVDDEGRGGVRWEREEE